jgi:hypothetical protein
MTPEQIEKEEEKFEKWFLWQDPKPIHGYPWKLQEYKQNIENWNIRLSSAKSGWLACAESYQAILKEKDEEIEGLKKEISWLKENIQYEITNNPFCSAHLGKVLRGKEAK